MQGLYAIVDVGAVLARGWDVLALAESVIAGGPVAIQLRDKRHASGQTLAWLRELAPICRSAGVRLLANDRPDLAALADCDGLHLGQGDLAPSEARRVLDALGADRRSGRWTIGMSVHDDVELGVALAARPDYLAFGPVFGTRSKENPEPTLGIERLARLVASTRERFAGPIVAIGGIDGDNLDQVRAHVDAIAMISALLPAADSPSPYAAVTARTRELSSRLPEASWT
ncbi:MAG: thiamine phosphate synthase [Polyangiaceae bacterium]